MMALRDPRVPALTALIAALLLAHPAAAAPGDPDKGETIYNHAISTMALCEAYAVSRDFTLKRWAEGDEVSL